MEAAHTQTTRARIYLCGPFPGPPEQHGLNQNAQLQSQLTTSVLLSYNTRGRSRAGAHLTTVGRDE